jgi:capsular polysaccharide biosynthesis protein
MLPLIFVIAWELEGPAMHNKTLDEIGLKYGSDKSSLVHDYLRIYEFYLNRFIDREVTLIEFGDRDGSSLSMWLDFFPKGTIIGIFPAKLAAPCDNDRIQIEVGRQHDTEFLNRIITRYRPDIVIDDGGHQWTEQITALKYLFPALRSGGVYIIEDLHTSFPPLAKIYSEGATVSGFAYLSSLLPGFVGGTESIADRADPFIGYSSKQIQSISFAPKTCVIVKSGTQSSDPIKITALEALGNVVTLDNGGAYRRGPITVLDAPNRLTQIVERERERDSVEPPTARVGFLSDVTVIGRGIVLTRDRQVVRESLINSGMYIHSFHRIGKTELLAPEGDLSPRLYLEDGECVLLKQTWDGNYGHWLIESLPRVSLVAALRPLTKCKFVVGDDRGAMGAVYTDTLSLFDIPEDRILAVPDEPTKIGRLIYPAPLTVQPWVKAPIVVKVLEGIADRLKDWGPHIERLEKLYVSRNNTGKRCLLNETEIIEIINRQGYRVIHPETMSFFEQVVTFSRARQVIGNLGAGLVNLVFAPRGVRLFALTSEFMEDDFFWDLVSHKEGSYLSLHGKADRPERWMQSDFRISVERFAEALMQFDRA